jgi:hypothetical protein
VSDFYTDAPKYNNESEDFPALHVAVFTRVCIAVLPFLGHHLQAVAGKKVSTAHAEN